HQIREARLSGRAPDTLLLLEHPPTITFGRRSGAGEMLMPREELVRQGFEFHEIERGGKATYHGPGQLVGYPIVSLRELGLDVPRFVRLLEQTLMDYLAGVGLSAQRRPGFPGVWVGGRKIGAVGVHLKRWVSIHGFALNLCPDLKHFEAIVPCGIEDAEVTSVEAQQGRSRRWGGMAVAKEGVAKSFSRAFGYERIDVAADQPISSG
ncbi:MAG: lipoyl(octanoyl) transferase LipB, partial [Dehalococcoidia bacterium]